MSLLHHLAEVRAIDALAARFPRHPQQWNKPHEADAELVQIAPDTYLAATIDAVVQEWSIGLFQDPYTAGWVLAMSSLSDLAAVGATPIGILPAITLPPGDATADRLAQGIAEAVAAAGTAVLGGDLDTGDHPHLTACALGLVHGHPIGRTGILPGDRIYATGQLGSGNMLAVAFLLGLPRERIPEAAHRPQARLAEGQLLRPIARAMMDTSDGPMSTLDHLARLNGVGFRIDFDLQRLIRPDALALAAGAGAPQWPLFCGELGEYELMVAVAPERAAELERLVPTAVPVAVAEVEPGLRLALPDGRQVAFDGSRIRNLMGESAGDWQAYTRGFMAFGSELGLA
jgi:thiamine-monophosphate kinase